MSARNHLPWRAKIFMESRAIPATFVKTLRAARGRVLAFISGANLRLRCRSDLKRSCNFVFDNQNNISPFSMKAFL